MEKNIKRECVCVYIYIKVGDGQGGLACCDSWGRKESDTTERLNWTELRCRVWWVLIKVLSQCFSDCRFSSVQFSSVAQSCLTLCDPMNHSTLGLPVHHQLLEFTQICIHRVSDAIQPSHPRSFSSSPAPNPSQHQSLFQWVNSSHEVAKVLEFQL